MRCRIFEFFPWVLSFSLSFWKILLKFWLLFSFCTAILLSFLDFWIFFSFLPKRLEKKHLLSKFTLIFSFKMPENWVFILSFSPLEFFSPWVFSPMAKKQPWIKSSEIDTRVPSLIQGVWLARYQWLMPNGDNWFCHNPLQKM